MRTTPLVLASLTAVFCLVALFLPWWGGEGSVSGSFMGQAMQDGGTFGAGPFKDGDGVITTGQATLTGVLMVLALAGAITGAVAALMGTRPLLRMGAAATGVTALLLLLLPLLAVLTWPGDAAFWDSGSASSGGASLSFSYAAQAGRYCAVAGLLTGAAATFAMGRDILGVPREQAASEA